MESNKIKTVTLYFGLIFISLGVVACLFGNVAGGSVVIITGLALMLLSQFQLESIKMLGLEAKLISTINDAEKVLEKLKKISLPISEIALATAAKSGRVGSATPSKDMMEYVMTIEEQLKGMGIKESELTAIKKPWIRTASYDLSSRLQQRFLLYYDFLSDKESEAISTLNDGNENDRLKKDEMLLKIKSLEAEKKAAQSLLSFDTVISYVDELISFINRSKALSESQQKAFIANNLEAINDINHLINTGQIRRPNHPDSFPIKD
ncbi:hypothetical protein [Pantoea sp. CFSAN033090]|uniref:hypothetical protein n=1 Tax=Pantoea sp. CFSAN033090 TaxID=1690502 RepID=UPI00068D72B4|nr:hypothetical protein [Pantoea sp. CFSAN033090]KOA72278.1 hypothetical protein AFL22_00545 [Pantoea sp. CFSAN033090]